MRTGRQDMVCYTPTDGTWNPMTPALYSAGFKTVRFRVWGAGMETAIGITVSAGVQFSKDGFNWDSPKRLYTLSAITEDRWNDGKSELSWTDIDLDAISGTPSRLLMRFGLFCKSGSGQRPLQADLEIVHVNRTNDSTLLTPWRIAYGSTTSADNTLPLTDALESARYSEVRLATEYVTGVATDSVCKYQAGIQQADDPSDPSNWSWVWTSAVVVNQVADVINAAAWENFSGSVTKPYFRVAARAQRNTAGSAVTLGRLRARIELRKVT